jgi:arylsulfatase A-like enzyme
VKRRVWMALIVAMAMGGASGRAMGNDTSPGEAARDLPASGETTTAGKPNVVLIVIDDLNDFVTGLGGYPQATTPHLRKLARSGVSFSHAYSNDPVCAPSRSSFLTGIYPHTSGNFYFDKWFENEVLASSKTLMEYFRDNGYHVAGSGKLMHHLRREVWSEFAHPADYGPVVYDGREWVAHPSVPQPYRSIGAIDGSFAPLSDVPYRDDPDPDKGWIYGTWGDEIHPFHYVDEENRSLTPDERNAEWAVEKLEGFARNADGPPFFLAVGFIRPHTPLHAPKRFFDMFPLEEVELPLLEPEETRGDTHYAGLLSDRAKGPRYFRLLRESYPTLEEGLRNYIRAYLACIAFVDEQMGRIVDAVDTGPLAENTIVVVVSDHGYHMGEKDYLFKDSPWEESTRIPFVVRAPGVTVPGGVSDRPVSLIDLYPTLKDLCGLEGDTRKNATGKPLDGHSLRPLLERPGAGEWEGPEGALTMVYAGESAEDPADPLEQHFSLRTRRWRYILYNDGAEELYDHDADPNEWVNLAARPGHEQELRELRRQLKAMIADTRDRSHDRPGSTDPM